MKKIKLFEKNEIIWKKRNYLTQPARLLLLDLDLSLQRSKSLRRLTRLPVKAAHNTQQLPPLLQLDREPLPPLEQLEGLLVRLVRPLQARVDKLVGRAHAPRHTLLDRLVVPLNELSVCLLQLRRVAHLKAFVKLKVTLWRHK